MKLIKKCIGLLLRKILPIKKKRIVFTSFSGHYNDNPKYIFEQMYLINNKLDYYWLVKKEYKNEVPKCANVAEIDTIKANYIYGSSHFIVDNNEGYRLNNLKDKRIISKITYIFRSFLYNKRNQRLYSTWHGTPLKKIGKDAVNANVIDCSCNNTEFILGDEYTLNIIDNLHFNKVDCKLIGCPRNDILHSDVAKVISIKKKLRLPLDKKIILFAPTFRTGDSEKNKDIERSGINQLQQINFEKLFKALKSKFGDDWVFIGRFHYHVEKMINWVDLKQKYGDKIINGNFGDDMAEYLACTDILLTDASSCMFDFMITNKPVFLFFPDFEHYLNLERGLYCDIKKLPFPFSKDFNILIKNIKDFDIVKYKKGVEKLEKEMNVIIDNNSSKKIAEYILKENNLL